jgi:hypothetical protein
MSIRKHYDNYVKTLNADEEILEVYRELRRAFQREGWTEEDLEKPPYYPTDILRNFQKFSNLRDKLFSELKNFFDIDHNEFVNYLQDKLGKINLEIPLENGNHERRNKRDEDY